MGRLDVPHLPVSLWQTGPPLLSYTKAKGQVDCGSLSRSLTFVKRVCPPNRSAHLPPSCSLLSSSVAKDSNPPPPYAYTHANRHYNAAAIKLLRNSAAPGTFRSAETQGLVGAVPNIVRGMQKNPVPLLPRTLSTPAQPAAMQETVCAGAVGMAGVNTQIHQ